MNLHHYPKVIDFLSILAKRAEKCRSSLGASIIFTPPIESALFTIATVVSITCLRWLSVYVLRGIAKRINSKFGAKAFQVSARILATFPHILALSLLGIYSSVKPR